MHAWVHCTNIFQYIKVLDSFLSSDSINTEADSRWIIQKYKQYLEMNNRPIIDHLSDDDKLSTLTQKKSKANTIWHATQSRLFIKWQHNRHSLVSSSPNFIHKEISALSKKKTFRLQVFPVNAH